MAMGGGDHLFPLQLSEPCKKKRLVLLSPMSFHLVKPRLDPLMPKLVTAGAMMTCSFGVAPNALIVTPENKLLAGAPGATIMDNIPIKKVPPSACARPWRIPVSPQRPRPRRARSLPCRVCRSFLLPGCPAQATLLVSYKPALHDGCKCMCAWGGVTGFATPGRLTTDVT